MPAKPRAAEGAPVDLAMWRRVLALSDNTMQPVIRNDLAALVALAESLTAEAARLEQQKQWAIEALQWCAGAAVQAMSCAPNGPKILEIEQVSRAALTALGTKGAGDGE